MMNLIQKMHALMVSPDVRIWQYVTKQEGPQFVFWLAGEGFKTAHTRMTLEELIDDAYMKIDPLLIKLPTSISPPNSESDKTMTG